MSYSVIRIIGDALQPLDPRTKGQYVVECDVDAFNGMGRLVTTDDPAKARHFENNGDAFVYYRRSSRVQPYRNDGKPNRPLTAWHVVIEIIEESASANQ